MISVYVRANYTTIASQLQNAKNSIREAVVMHSTDPFFCVALCRLHDAKDVLFECFIGLYEAHLGQKRNFMTLSSSNGNHA